MLRFYFPSLPLQQDPISMRELVDNTFKSTSFNDAQTINSNRDVEIRDFSTEKLLDENSLKELGESDKDE
ncbi:MAG: hypothetical protein A3J60_02160 [Candidatus Pacebacteria bacterium RIFCSPHIGHO2_02_FULL_46_9]|nr:MAG: hypothetical protein A3J60_02160 [Candidatus Pacebacteria bacterium RIFCSPHIGHO2_02_FULL_46_9]